MKLCREPARLRTGVFVMKIAVSAYAVEPLQSWAAYCAKQTKLCEDAARAGAQLLVFPEYGAMELAGWAEASALSAQMDVVSGRLPRMWDHFGSLAARLGVHILAPSGPYRAQQGFVNRAMMLAPSGKRQAIDKQIMTLWERAPMGVRAGAPLVVMDTQIGRIGVLICYDCEFPLLARAQCETGAEVLLVPSATESLAGFYRVRTGAMARALEGQCAVVHAPLVGQAPWCDVIEENTGRAGVYVPMDRGMPPTGILAEGGMDRPGWTFADVDLKALEALRKRGEVRGAAHWMEQPGADAKERARCDLVSLV